MKKSVLFILGVLVFGTVISCKKEKSTTVESSSETNNFKVSPPLKGIDIPFETYSINPVKDTVLYHSSGAVIKIPKNAFLNLKGEVITTVVDLQFRSFSNPLDTYLAGIPMTYQNETGEEFVFESAGMFEINASLPEENVTVNPENKINVTLNSFSNDSNFNTYDLKQDTGVWIETGKDLIRNESKEKDLSVLPELPIAPKRAGKFAFKISDELNKKSKLSDYKNVLFEPVNGKKIGFDSKNIKVKDLNNGTYEVEFIPWVITSDNISTKVICNLAFDNEKDYQSAMKKYQKKYAEKIKRAELIRAPIERAWKIYERQLIEYRAFYTKVEINNANLSTKIVRTLEVNNFGFVNCDRPIDYPQGADVVFNAVDEKGTALKLHDLVLIEIGQNALFRYKTNIQFNPKSKNMLWGLTENDKLAYFTVEDFKSITKTSGNVTFKMRVYQGEIKSYEDVLSILFPDNTK